MNNARKALDKLFVSRVRIKLLKYFFTKPDVPIHLRGAVRELSEEINAVRRELMRMEEINLVKTDVRGNRKYYLLNTKAQFFDELRGLVIKTFGLGGEIIENQTKLGDIQLAVITGEYLSGRHLVDNPVDLLLVGSVDMQSLEELISRCEKTENKSIHYTVFTSHDFDLRRRRKDSFVTNLLVAPKVVLIGRQEDLLA